MSLFVKDYKSIIAALKAEQLKNKENTPTTTNANILDDLFSSSIYNISDVSIYPIDHKHMYKKSFARKHTYRFKTPAIQPNPSIDPYADVYLIVPQMYEEVPLVDQDFLTGYFIAKWLIMPKHISKFKSFHSGISSDGITKGMFYALATNPKPIKWDFFGCDKNIKKEYTKCYVNGLSKPCNVFDINTVRSINIQLGEKTKDLNLYIGDIRPKSFRDFMCQLLLCYGFIKDNNVIILRLPVNWASNFTAMVNILLYFISQYNVVKIFKTPWGKNKKLYLIISEPKENHSASKYTTIMKYIEAVSIDPTLPFYNQLVFEVDETQATDESTQATDESKLNSDGVDLDDMLKPKSFMTIFINNVSHLYKQLIEYNTDTSNDEANTLWTQVMELIP